MDFKDYFVGKKVTLMGLGLLGRGVGDAAFLAECGAELIVTDLKTEAELKPSLERLAGYSNITYRLGEHKEEDFSGRDLVIVGPNVPEDSKYLARAREASTRVTMSAALFAELSKIPIIGVTGTRGKSTVTHMIHHVLSVATGEPIILGGNIRGVSNLQLLQQVTAGSLAVMELDSWQLRAFGWNEISPQVAVFTNLMPDHMNFYQGDMRAYFADKANIFAYQENSDVLITTPEVFAEAKEYGYTMTQEVVLADASVLPEDCLLAMPGEHNRLNAALAYEALKATSLSDELIFEGLASFGGVEGRLQYVKEVNGVKIYNDNNATTSAATAAGIAAVAAGKNVVLIAGGADKGLDISLLTTTIAKHCKQVILIPGTGTDGLVQELPEAVLASDLAAALEEARLAAAPGDIILFSPAFASFGQYNNEYERNDEFMRLVDNL